MTPIRLVIGVLGAALLLSIALIGLLAVNAQGIPDVLQNVAVGTVTALAALLVRPTSTGAD